MSDALDTQRERIRQLLEDGLQTNWQQRAYSDEEIRSVVTQLHELKPDDLQGRLRIGGFTLTPYVGDDDPEIEQSCLTCMYYEPHRRYCALPALKLAVEPEWSCILWRI